MVSLLISWSPAKFQARAQACVVRMVAIAFPLGHGIQPLKQLTQRALCGKLGELNETMLESFAEIISFFLVQDGAEGVASRTLARIVRPPSMNSLAVGRRFSTKWPRAVSDEG